MGRVKAGSLRLQEAAELLGLSYRQAKRVWARYRGGGAKALQHGNCGRVSNRAHPEEFRQAVLVQVGRRYADFGAASERESRIASAGCASRISANWCSWMPAFIPGWKIAPPTAVSCTW